MGQYIDKNSGEEVSEAEARNLARFGGDVEAVEEPTDDETTDPDPEDPQESATPEDPQEPAPLP